jgi:hypothetical protein
LSDQRQRSDLGQEFEDTDQREQDPAPRMKKPSFALVLTRCLQRKPVRP